MSSNRRRIVGFAVIACALALVVGVVAWRDKMRHGGIGKKDAVVVAWSPFESTALVWVAEAQGLFGHNGLEITWRKYDSGAASLNAVVAGEADVAVGVTEFPLVRKALGGQKVLAIANIDKGEFIYIVASKSQGIETVADLKGKRIGTTLGTISEFYLGRFLGLNGIAQNEVTVVDLRSPAQWVNAVADGEVAAVCTAQPYVNQARSKLGDDAIYWRAQSRQPQYSLVITSEKWLAEHPDVTRRLLVSLAEAEAHLVRNPHAASAALQQRLNLPPEYGETLLSQNQFCLSLEQSLVAAMEDEARWMIRNNLTPKQDVPNFLDYIHEKVLQDVKPGAVYIIR